MDDIPPDGPFHQTPPFGHGNRMNGSLNHGEQVGRKRVGGGVAEMEEEAGVEDEPDICRSMNGNQTDDYLDLRTSLRGVAGSDVMREYCGASKEYQEKEARYPPNTFNGPLQLSGAVFGDIHQTYTEHSEPYDLISLGGNLDLKPSRSYQSSVGSGTDYESITARSDSSGASTLTAPTVYSGRDSQLNITGKPISPTVHVRDFAMVEHHRRPSLRKASVQSVSTQPTGSAFTIDDDEVNSEHRFGKPATGISSKEAYPSPQHGYLQTNVTDSLLGARVDGIESGRSSIDTDSSSPDPLASTLGRKSLVSSASRGRQSARRRLGPSASLALQAFPSLVLSAFGLIFSGELLEKVSTWTVFRRVDELFILVPILSNLKGNLEMVLAAKLGTEAHKGHLDRAARRYSIIMRALLHLQFQGSAIALIAGILAFILGLSSEHQVLGEHGIVLGYTPPGIGEMFVVISTTMLTMMISSAALGSFMSFLVVACRWIGVDPDNVALPIAACLGDLVTLWILAVVGSVVVRGMYSPLPAMVTVLMCIFTILCGWKLVRIRSGDHRHMGKVSQDDISESGGWLPLIGAMVISAGCGLVLDRYVTRFKGFALMAIAMTGVSGSIGSIYVSRRSTALQLRGPDKATLAMTLSSATQIADSHDVPDIPQLQTALVLFLVAWPVQFLFLLTVHLFGWIDLDRRFTAWICLAYGLTVICSLFVAHHMTNFFFYRGMNPDACTLPIHSAFIDLIGQLLLVLAFSHGGTVITA